MQLHFQRLNLCSVFHLGIVCVVSRIVCGYLGFNPELLVFIALGSVLYLCSCVYFPQFGLFDFSFIRSIRLNLLTKLLIGCFSFLLSFSIVISSHIVIGSSYAGTIIDNFISPLGKLDLIGLLVIAISLFIVVSSLCKLAGYYLKTFVCHTRSIHVTPILLKELLLLFLVSFVLWFPYLLVYWPGFVFSDSVSSITQALEIAPLSNHHPVILALMLRSCIHTASLFGFGTTVGIGFFSFLQLIFVSASIAYACAWFPSRLSLPRFYAFVLLFLFSLSGYVASYSVAIWKDPIFSCSLLILFLFVFDYCLSFVEKIKVPHVFLLAVLMFLTMFMRNNGVYIILVISAVFLFGLLFRRFSNRGVSFALLLLSIFCVAFYFLITGPIYKQLGVLPTEKVETYGIPLNQMARVAALDGDMTESDAAFMNEILPLDEYKEKYRPCCTDGLKWDQNFNGDAIDSSFLSHWLSMFIRNPKIYFDAWILQTVGYWSVNQSDVISTDWNIDGGVPHNWDGSLGWLDVFPSNLLGIDSLQSVFPFKETSIPCGWIFWTLILICIIFISAGVPSYILGLLPILALIGTLLIASPIWYWPRYFYAAQLVFPFCFAFAFLTLYRRVGSVNGSAAGV